MDWRHPIGSILARFGYFKHSFPDQIFREIDCLFDVGANSGQSYKRFRDLGFDGDIFSFEPNPEEYAKLLRIRDPLWHVHQLALSDIAGNVDFHIARSSDRSSIHKGISEHHGDASEILKTITVRCTTLSAFWLDSKLQFKNCYLKVDTEGNDFKVLAGAANVLENISYVEVECRTVPYYEGEPVIFSYVEFLKRLNYNIIRIDPVHSNENHYQEVFNILFKK